jgi:hypothetical protein
MTMRRTITFVVATIIAMALAFAPYALATGARAQMDGTSLKSINSDGDTLAEMDGTGLRLTPDAGEDPLVVSLSRMYRFGSSRIGMGYNSYYSLLAFATAGGFRFQFNGTPTYEFFMTKDPTSGRLVFGPWNGDSDIRSTTFYGGSTPTAGADYNSLVCTGGEAVTSMTVHGGIVTDANCGALPGAKASEVAALRSEVASLRAEVARLAADKAR